jgi:Cdc6-like AAA superfamily ATPase
MAGKQPDEDLSEGEPDANLLRAFRFDTLFEVFSPSAPVDREEIFAGRADQLAALAVVSRQRGQHGVIYGERGVGKTSLARICAERARQEDFFVANVTCDSGDNFLSIWTKVLEEISVVVGGEHGNALQFLREGQTTPNEVRLVLRQLASEAKVLIFVDEFDQVATAEVKKRMAETVKILSDNSVRATLVIVGVAQNVTELIEQHESVARAIVQVQMPRLRPRELSQIIDKGLAEAGMTITVPAANRIVNLSQGLPHYVHRLAQQAGLQAAGRESGEVSADDVTEAISIVVTDMNESIGKDYHAATWSGRSDAIFGDVLLACACAQADERGYFAASAVEAPLTRIRGKQYKVPAFAKHLQSFHLDDDRGRVLVRDGSPGHYRYRFREPLLQPYVIMRGLRDKKITDADLRGTNGTKTKTKTKR